jgi:hypothetical protein
MPSWKNLIARWLRTWASPGAESDRTDHTIGVRDINLYNIIIKDVSLLHLTSKLGWDSFKENNNNNNKKKRN